MSNWKFRLVQKEFWIYIYLKQSSHKMQPSLMQYFRSENRVGKNLTTRQPFTLSNETFCFCLLGPSQTGSSITEEFPRRGKSFSFSWCFWSCFMWAACPQSPSVAGWRWNLWAGSIAGVRPSCIRPYAGCICDTLCLCWTSSASQITLHLAYLSVNLLLLWLRWHTLTWYASVTRQFKCLMNAV